MKDACRTSSACRRGRFAVFFIQTRFTLSSWRRAIFAAAAVSLGNSWKNDSSRGASNEKVGGNCQSSGPTFSCRRKTPEAKKVARGAAQFFRRRKCVIYLGALTEKRKSGGVCSYQVA